MFRAIRQGLRHLAVAPGLVPIVWLASLLVAVPAAVVVEEAIHDSIAGSLARQWLAEGFDSGWYGEFEAETEGLAATLSPSHVGLGAVLDALESWWSGSLFSAAPEVVAFGVAFALVWLFLLGGVLSRLQRPWDRVSLAETLATGGRFFARFLRLTLIAAPFYYGVFRLSAWLFPWITRLTRDVTSEREILIYNAAAALVVVLMLTLVKLVVDYARVSMVIEGRTSAVAAAARGAGFFFGRPLATLAIVAVFGLATLLLLAVYAALAPGVAQSGPLAIVLAIAGSQLFLMARLALRLGLLSSQLAFFEDQAGRRL